MVRFLCIHILQHGIIVHGYAQHGIGVTPHQLSQPSVRGKVQHFLEEGTRDEHGVSTPLAESRQRNDWLGAFQSRPQQRVHEAGVEVGLIRERDQEPIGFRRRRPNPGLNRGQHPLGVVWVVDRHGAAPERFGFNLLPVRPVDHQDWVGVGGFEPSDDRFQHGTLPER